MKPLTFLELVDEYLAFKRGLGFELKSRSWMLRDFGRYADQTDHQGHITIDLAVRWALSTRSTRSTDPGHAAVRLSTVAMFARHCALFDAATEVPPAGLLGRASRTRKQPHIYSNAEITALLRQASLLEPRKGLRPKTYVTLFSLLLSTGLRLSEACRLACRDTDLVAGVITVREGKFRKSRFVPLHPSATQALADYAAHRDKCRAAPRSEYFFRSERAPALTKPAVDWTFRSLREHLGWSAQGRARRPRIHDMRHTFAVRRLVKWYQEGASLDGKIVSLATYLGHAKPSATYWYLSAVPELMAIASERFEHLAGSEQELPS
jgi:integrase